LLIVDVKVGGAPVNLLQFVTLLTNCVQFVSVDTWTLNRGCLMCVNYCAAEFPIPAPCLQHIWRIRNALAVVGATASGETFGLGDPIHFR
jgi:hypothetical protein